MVLSRLQLARSFPWGEKATARTEPVWPSSVRTCSPCCPLEAGGASRMIQTPIHANADLRHTDDVLAKCVMRCILVQAGYRKTVDKAATTTECGRATINVTTDQPRTAERKPW